VGLHIRHLAEKLGFPLKKLLWMNGSLRSDHSNAYYYGFGNTKVIVLYDTLLQRLHPKETASVVCHELGHWKHNHSFKKLCIYLLEVLSLFYIFSFFLRNDEVFISFGFADKSVLDVLYVDFYRYSSFLSSV
jgi:STE24 endopeptidase